MSTPHTHSWRGRLDLVATAAMIAASTTLIWAVVSARINPPPITNEGGPTSRPTKPIPAAAVSLEGMATKGSQSAPVVVIVYSDYECPFCAKFHNETLPQIVEHCVKPGKVLLAFQHFPIERIHRSAVKAAEAAECSGKQGQFWAMTDELFRQPVSLDKENLRLKAAGLGLDMQAFNHCLEGETEAHVRQNLTQARALSINSTPTFLIGTRAEQSVKVARHESGAIPIKAFASMLDEVAGASGR